MKVAYPYTPYLVISGIIKSILCHKSAELLKVRKIEIRRAHMVHHWYGPRQQTLFLYFWSYSSWKFRFLLVHDPLELMVKLCKINIHIIPLRTFYVYYCPFIGFVMLDLTDKVASLTNAFHSILGRSIVIHQGNNRCSRCFFPNSLQPSRK